MKIRTSYISLSLLPLVVSSNLWADVLDNVEIGGFARTNYQYLEYNEASKDKGGDLKFDTFALKVDASYDDLRLLSEYRFYEGYQVLRNAYVTYDYNDLINFEFGLMQVPFGNPGVISNSFWYGITNYVGFEDDNDMGVKSVLNYSGWTTDIAFFKGAEYSSSHAARYTPDLFSGVIDGRTYYNEETNQFNLRQYYTFEYEQGRTVLSASGMYGDIYNSETKRTGDRNAFAVAADILYQGWNLQLQFMSYEFDAPDADDPNRIAVSSFNWAYEIVSKANLYSANIAKTVDTDWGSIKFYNDYNLLTPEVSDKGYDDSVQNVTGVAIAYGATYTMIDLIVGKNMYASSNASGVGLPSFDNDYEKRININFGYYF